MAAKVSEPHSSFLHDGGANAGTAPSSAVAAPLPGALGVDSEDVFAEPPSHNSVPKPSSHRVAPTGHPPAGDGALDDPLEAKPGADVTAMRKDILYVPKGKAVQVVVSAQERLKSLQTAGVQGLVTVQSAYETATKQAHDHYVGFIQDVRRRANEKLAAARAARGAALSELAQLRQQTQSQIADLSAQLQQLQSEKAELLSSRATLEKSHADLQEASTSHLAELSAERDELLNEVELARAQLRPPRPTTEAGVDPMSPRLTASSVPAESHSDPRPRSDTQDSDLDDQRPGPVSTPSRAGAAVHSGASAGAGEAARDTSSDFAAIQAEHRAEIARLNKLLDKREEMLQTVELERAKLIQALEAQEAALPPPVAPKPATVNSGFGAALASVADHSEEESSIRRKEGHEEERFDATSLASAPVLSPPRRAGTSPKARTPVAGSTHGDSRELSAVLAELESARKEIKRLKAAGNSNTTGAGISSPSANPDQSRLDEADVKALRLAEAQADRLRDERNAAQAEVSELKHKLRVWVADFEAREGRKPEKEDKQVIREDFVAYRDAENKAKKLARKLATAVSAVEELRTSGGPSPARSANTVDVFAAGGMADEDVAVPRDDEVSALKAWAASATDTVATGKRLWGEKKKRECLHLFKQHLEDLQADLQADARPVAVSLEPPVTTALSDADALITSEPAQAALTLRKALDTFILSARRSIEKHASTVSGDNPALRKAQRQVTVLTAEIDRLQARVNELESSHHGSGDQEAGADASDEEDNEDDDEHDTDADPDSAGAEETKDSSPTAGAGGPASTRTSKSGPSATTSKRPGAGGRSKVSASSPTSPTKPAVSSAAAARNATKVKTLEKTVKDLRTKIRQLEAAASRPAASSGAQVSAKEAEKAVKVVERKLADAEKKAKKEAEESAKSHKREVAQLKKAIEKATAEVDTLKDSLAAVTGERDKLKADAGKVGSMEKELEELRSMSSQLVTTRQELQEASARATDLEKLYKEEQILRKRYWNMMEDMKGKIRVFARCRPMSSTELERGSTAVVQFPDDVTLELVSSRGTRQFVYDQCFGPTSTQEEVFEDTRNLVQSALDGFNVCIFAYGQTGSGKTFTMTGSPDLPGIIPRTVATLFRGIESTAGVCKVRIESYMVELYNDVLIDLFYLLDHKKKGFEKAPRLDISKDSNGMVVIKNVIMRTADTPEDLLRLFDEGNRARHVGSTKMNAESSRSHLVFAVLITSYNSQTGKTARGKLSLVDLAGSERVGKTGASAERLREAQSINKSLSALGDVISALSSGEKFVPYRNNKLTQLMSDSLGGNAKTLMFVNISPADYNADETQTSLVYASRVKLITNSASKNAENAEITRLKRIIADLKAGGTGDIGEDDEAAGPSSPAAGAGGAASS